MGKEQVQLGVQQYVIILLALITALIHIYLAFRFPDGPDAIFILNGVGYVGLVALLYAPLSALDAYRPFVRWVLMGYTALTIFLWLMVGAGSPLTNTPSSPIAYIDKAVEVALLVLLWLDQPK
ncbi:MAG: hypothetical protein DCC55_02415 [Chloroflexi bacterium]|nr:MAG: hypothetical protein DCC55_02415 [Chloroflexota bacterium]